MSERQNIDETVEDILRILEEFPHPPEASARAAIRQAANARHGGLRQRHLNDAQRHIANIDASRKPGLVQRLQAQVLALQGRGGDTQIAHLTPGEIVVPRWLQTPEFLQILQNAARRAGIDPATLRVGNGRNSINPYTGQMEFDEEQIAASSDTSSAEPSTQSQEPIETVTVTGQRPWTIADTPLVARLIYAEGAGDYKEPGAMEAIASVLKNRLDSGQFGKTVQDVISQHNAFASAQTGRANELDRAEWVANHVTPAQVRLGAPTPEPPQDEDPKLAMTPWEKWIHPGEMNSPADRAAYDRAWSVAQQAISGQLPDNTGGATFFHAGTVPPNDWYRGKIATGGLARVGQFGSQTFYRQLK